MKIPIRPLSTNALFRGGPRYKTNEYKRYLRDLGLLLPPLTIPPGKLSLRIIFAFSNPKADLDNCCKAFIDAIQQKYHFDDCRVYDLHMKKVVVPQGEEHIAFTINGDTLTFEEF